MHYPELHDILYLQRRLIDCSGGAHGLLNLAAVESSLMQPRMTFGGEELYPTLVEKAAMLGFSLIQNHGFVDGNKRIGQAAMELLLALNGFELRATTDEQEKIILQVASGQLKRETFAQWIENHLVPFQLDQQGR